MISGITKDEAGVISRGWRPSLITLAETLIIPGITKIELNYFFYYIRYFMENIQTLLCEMQVDFASKNTRTNAPSSFITRNHSSACAL